MGKVKQNEGKDIKMKMATEPMVPLVISVSLPLVISLLVQALYNLVDSFFVARISENALTATSLASPIQLLMVAVSVGTGVGINSLLSRSLGAGEKEKVNLTATTGLLLAIISSVVFMCFGLFFSRYFLCAYTNDVDLLNQSYSYLSICTVFCSGIFVAAAAERMLQATGKSIYSMCAQVSGAVLNCVLDPILIFGYFGFPAMGVKGAAIATVTGQWVAAILAMILNLRLNREIRFDFKNFKFKKEIVKGIYKVGAPAMLTNGIISIQTICINKLLIDYSATAVAFFGLYHKIQTFVMMPNNGFAQGQIPIAGFSYGAKRGDRLMEVFYVTIKICFVVMLAGTLLFEFLPEQILLLFSASDEMLEIGVSALRILASTFILVSAVTVIGQLLTAIGNGMVNMVCTIVRGMLPLLLLLVIVKTADIGYIWYAFPFADLVAFVLALILFRQSYKKEIYPLMEKGKR
ncbi:MAG: MATE family efflux transporter [Lachnospiraceae bacterium]|nr:MATE family efflux transporter [Lachnospiraceae bacterium]